ncbi:MAG: hypothetical protein CL927_04515 [Deltaproteobacteria bacterium]|nr:hypothetical protein [Deltaproteobacteria bacterium]HCH64966.1 hypothetical protein [Deltaproteobacteria bacterium]
MNRPFCGVFLVISAVACGSNKSDPAAALQECADPGDIDEATLIAWDFEQSMHEMIQCGNLSAQLNQSLHEAAHTLLLNPAQAPEAFSYSDGKFRVAQDDVSMTMTITCGAMSLGCTEGDVIAADPFLVESYLVGAQPEQFDGATLVIPYDAPGPLVRLLGQGANPPNPIRISAAELVVFGNNIQQLRVNTVVELDTLENDSTITYSVKTGRLDLKDLHADNEFAYELKEAAGTRGAQTADPIRWNVTFVDGGLLGDVELEVLGGVPEYTARFSYGPASMTPLVEMKCISAGESDDTASVSGD